MTMHKRSPNVIPTPEQRARVKVSIVSGKPKAWSHQNDLSELVGKKIKLQVREIGVVNGTLVAADQFTLKLEVEAFGRSLFEVYNKSQLIYFSQVSL